MHLDDVLPVRPYLAYDAGLLPSAGFIACQVLKHNCVPCEQWGEVVDPLPGIKFHLVAHITFCQGYFPVMRDRLPGRVDVSHDIGVGEVIADGSTVQELCG